MSRYCRKGLERWVVPPCSQTAIVAEVSVLAGRRERRSRLHGRSGPFDEESASSRGLRRAGASRRCETSVAASGLLAAFADVIKVNAYVADLGEFEAFNDIYREYFTEPYPARTTVGASLVEFKIEVEAIARKAS